MVCVPTPLRDGAPDLRYIEDAARLLAPHVRAGATVVLESTTYPGTTEEVFVPILEAGSGLRAGADFHVGYSPERIDPSNPTWGLQNTPKIVSGIDEASSAAVTAFYDTVVDRTVPAPGTREAELAKLLENTFRHVNIALVNELAVYCHELGIDVWSVIDMAATKPFGFMRFTPGPRRRRALPADRPVVPVVAGPPGARSHLPVRRDRQRRQRQHARLRRHAGDRAPQPPQAGRQRQPGPAGRADLQAELGRRPPVAGHRRRPAARRPGRDAVRGVDPLIDAGEVPAGVQLVDCTPETVEAADIVVVLTDHDDDRLGAPRAPRRQGARHPQPADDAGSGQALIAVRGGPPRPAHHDPPELSAAGPGGARAPSA